VPRVNASVGLQSTFKIHDSETWDGLRHVPLVSQLYGYVEP